MTCFFKGGLAASTLVLCIASSDIAAAQDATLKVGGRVQIDYTLADLSGPDANINDTELRRARLNVSGKYGSALKYKFELNTNSSGDINAEDAYIQFVPADSPFKVKVGQFKTHNSLDEETSSRFMSVIERAAFTDAFSFDRRVGVSVATSGKNYTFDVGAFTTNLENNGGTDEGHAFAARGTFNPVKTDETLVHLGASWRFRSRGDTASDLRFRQRPFTHVAPDRIINTGRFAKSDNFFGAEAAVIHNNIWASGEYATLAANGSGTNPDADFSGFYGEVGVFFGGKKTYKGGKFNRPKVDNPIGEGGMGAVSIVARYDSVDLQDAIYTGELDTIVLGADWWPTKQTRISINYFDADAENGSANSANGLVGRMQFDF